MDGNATSSSLILSCSFFWASILAASCSFKLTFFALAFAPPPRRCDVEGVVGAEVEGPDPAVLTRAPRGLTPVRRVAFGGDFGGGFFPLLRLPARTHMSRPANEKG